MTRRAKAFLKAYRDCWSVAPAAAAVNQTRQSHYRRLERDKAYKEAFLDIEEEIRDGLREEIRQRAIDGIKGPIMYKGQQCRDHEGNLMFYTEYSDRLLELMLKAHGPEYRNQLDVALPKDVNIRVVYECDGIQSEKVS